MATLTIDSKDLYSKFPVWGVNVDNIPFDREFFENPDIWKNNSLSNQNYTVYPSERKEYIDGSDKNFDNWFLEFKNNNNILELIIENIEQESNIVHFYREYPIEDKGIRPGEFIKKHCNILYRVMKDEAGYTMNKHFDNRAVFGNIFFNLTDNGNTATEFFNTFSTGYNEVLDPNSNLMYKGPIKKGEGIWFMNNPHLLHSIDNRGELNRFVINILIYFPQLTH